MCIGVQVNWCSGDLLFKLYWCSRCIGVQVYWCSGELVFGWIGVQVHWRSGELAFMWIGVQVNWCSGELAFRWIGVHMNWCSGELVFGWIGVQENWCSGELVFMWNWNFLDRFSKNTQIWNFIKIRPVGTELLLADRRAGQTDRRTDRHFAKCPNHWHDNLVHNVLFDKWANKIWQDWERLRKQNKWLWHAVICETGEMASLNTS